jgi:hypothetical protein
VNVPYFAGSLLPNIFRFGPWITKILMYSFLLCARRQALP